MRVLRAVKGGWEEELHLRAESQYGAFLRLMGMSDMDLS